MFLTNAVGVIDSGHRGEITIKMHVTTDAAQLYTRLGERVLFQLIIMPIPEVTLQR